MGEPMIGQRIRELRERQGMSQAALARALGASANAINYIELGSTRAPHIDRLMAIADLFNVSLDYLVGRSDDATPPKRPRRKRTPPAPADDAGAGEAVFCPECGVGDGCHMLDCTVHAASIAHNPEAQANLRRGRLLTQKLLELAGKKA